MFLLIFFLSLQIKQVLCRYIKKIREQLSLFPNCLAEREGFEPPEPLSSTVFKTAAIDHSAISPRTALLLKRVALFLKSDAKIWRFYYTAKFFCNFFRVIFHFFYSNFVKAYNTIYCDGKIFYKKIDKIKKRLCLLFLHNFLYSISFDFCAYLRYVA